MEELFPLLIFIVIIIVNAAKFFTQQKPKSEPGEEGAPQRKASPLEDFLREIAEKVEPKPREVPDWPENVERPDYLQEMQEFKQHRTTPEQPKRSAPPPPPPPAPMPEMSKMQKKVKSLRSVKPTSFKISVKGMYVPGMNFPQGAQAPILRSATGKTSFDLGSRKSAKKALIAQMVFSGPRAYERSFDNSIAP